MQEIATLEVEISRLEHHLLSLYRKAFQQHLPRVTEDQVETPRGGGRLNQPSQKDRQCENSPTSSLAGPRDSAQVSFQKSSSYAGRVDTPRLFSFINLLFLKNMHVYISFREISCRRSRGLIPSSVVLQIILEILA